MGYSLATLVLSPLLILQGKRVRRTVPLLPEPVGARAGRYGNGERLDVLVVGDSSAAGVGVTSQDQGLMGSLTSVLAPTYSGRYRLVAKTGHRLRDTLKALDDVEPEKFDLVVVSVGVNDATGGTSPRTWRNELGKLADVLEAKFSPHQVVFSAIPPMDRFPALPQPLRWYMGMRSRRLNEVTRSLVLQKEWFHFLEMDMPVGDRSMASDGYHPNEDTYLLWAQGILHAIRSRFA